MPMHLMILMILVSELMNYRNINHLKIDMFIKIYLLIFTFIVVDIEVICTNFEDAQNNANNNTDPLELGI